MIGRRLGRWAALAGAVLLAAASSLRAQEVTSLFPARPAGHLTDAARVVPADAAQRIEAIARDLRTRTGAELAVVTLPTIGDREPEEVALAKHLLSFGFVLEAVAEECRPNYLCNYLYELAGHYARFYEACPVLKAEEPQRSSRLVLCGLVGKVLEQGLQVLGIETPERM